MKGVMFNLLEAVVTRDHGDDRLGFGARGLLSQKVAPG